MVRRPERCSTDHADGRQTHAGGRVDHRGLEGQRRGQRRQQTRHPLGEHGLACARRADEQQVVPAGGGDLQRLAGGGLAAHVGQVGDRRFVVDEVVVGLVGPRRDAVEGVDDLAQVRGNSHPAGRDGPRLAERRPRHDRDQIVEGADHRSDTGDRTQRAVEPELADEAEPGDGLGRDLIVGDQQPDRDRQVEPGPALALIRRARG